MSETKKSENKEVLKQAAKTIQTLMDEAMCKQILPRAAKYFVEGFASLWEENGNPSLTGNTFTSFCVGLYRNSSIIGYYGITNLLNVTQPTNNPVDVGEYGFYDYDSGEFIGDKDDPAVMDYGASGLKWQGHSYETGQNQSRAFLAQYKPSTKGYTLVACVGTDYAAWLEKVRGLDILTSVRTYAASNVTTAVVQYKNLNNGKL